MEIYCAEQCIAGRVAYCADRVGRGLGLSGRRSLDDEAGLLMELAGYQQGRTGLWVAIHMLGVCFPLAVAWLDREGCVVHRLLARPGGLYYSSPLPAWYTLELHAAKLPLLEIGARLRWTEARGCAG